MRNSPLKSSARYKLDVDVDYMPIFDHKSTSHAMKASSSLSAKDSDVSLPACSSHPSISMPGLATLCLTTPSDSIPVVRVPKDHHCRPADFWPVTLRYDRIRTIFSP